MLPKQYLTNHRKWAITAWHLVLLDLQIVPFTDLISEQHRIVLKEHRLGVNPRIFNGGGGISSYLTRNLGIHTVSEWGTLLGWGWAEFILADKPSDTETTWSLWVTECTILQQMSLFLLNVELFILKVNFRKVYLHNQMPLYYVCYRGN